MSRPRRWTPLKTQHLQDCAVFQLSRTVARSPRDGSSHPFYRIDSADWVNVVPLTAAGELVMVRQYRHGSRSITLEIPGGLIDRGEQPAEAAARELLEETGHRAGTLAPVGAVNPNPAIFGNRCHTFVATGCERVAEVRNDSTEETVVELVPRDQLRARMKRGEIDHALVLAGLYWWELSERGGS